MNTALEVGPRTAGAASREEDPVPDTDPREAFVVRHQASVWRYLRFLGADGQLAEELALEVLWQALRHRLWESPESSARRWLRQASRSVLVSTRRRERRLTGRQLPLEDLDPHVLERAFDELGDDGGETALAALHECLRQLAGRDREVIELRYRQGGSRAEMAARLGLSESGVKQLLRRVRAKLRVCVQGRVERTPSDVEGGES